MDLFQRCLGDRGSSTEAHMQLLYELAVGDSFRPKAHLALYRNMMI